MSGEHHSALKALLDHQGKQLTTDFHLVTNKSTHTNKWCTCCEALSYVTVYKDRTVFLILISVLCLCLKVERKQSLVCEGLIPKCHISSFGTSGRFWVCWLQCDAERTKWIQAIFGQKRFKNTSFSQQMYGNTLNFDSLSLLETLLPNIGVIKYCLLLSKYTVKSKHILQGCAIWRYIPWA